MGKEIVKITDYDEILTLLIQQYQDKPNFKAILQALNTQAEDLETALFELRDNYWITSAVGDQLDVIGAIQSEARQGKTDTNYRNAIEARIVVNNGSGEFETIITALVDILGATYCQTRNIGNAKLYIWTDLLVTEEQFNTIVTFLASGVGLYLHVGSDNPFVFLDDPDGTGFGKIDDTIQLQDVSGNNIQDVSGNNILTIANEADPNNGGEFQGIWSTE